MNNKIRVEYWLKGADSDIETAGILIENKKYLHGLFFCHLAIEKILKAHVTKTTDLIPPKSHNLFRLLEIANIEITDDTAEFLGVLMKYQLEGRYPDFSLDIPGKNKVIEYLLKTKEILLWLKKIL
jgi:HEPN domain-containing protein